MQEKETSSVSSDTPVVYKYQTFSDIDDFFERVGYGKFQFTSILLSFFVISIEGIQLTLVSNMFIPMQHYYQMSNISMDFASALIFIGVGIGSALIGFFITAVTTRVVITKVVMAIMIIVLLGSSFINNAGYYFFSRIVTGFCCGIQIPIVLNVLCEILPVKKRTFCLTSIWSSFGIGQCIPPIFMMIFMPNYEFDMIPIVFILIWFYTFGVGILFMAFFFDSPRNLYMTNRPIEGKKIVDEMALEIGEVLPPTASKLLSKYYKRGENLLIKKITICYIFKSHYLLTSLILLFLWIVNAMLFYGPLFVYSLTMRKLGIADSYFIILSLIVGGIVGVIILVGVAYFSETKETGIGIKYLSLICYAIITLDSVFITVFPNQLYVWIAFLFFFVSAVSNAISTYTSSIYPTKMRDHALGFFYSITRVGGFASNFLFLYLFNVNPMLPYYVVLGLSAGSFVLTLFLKMDPSGKTLDSDLD